MEECDYYKELNVPLSKISVKCYNEDYGNTACDTLAHSFVQENKDVVIKDYEHLCDLLEEFIDKSQSFVERSSGPALLLEVWANFQYMLDTDSVANTLFDLLIEEE